VFCTFRKSKAKEINKFYNLMLKNNEVAVFYLGVSGVLARTSNQAVLIDPAGFLKKEEILTLKTLNLLLFTHDHLDHFSGGATQAIFKASATPILAEAKVAKKLNGKIPAEKLVIAENQKTYNFGDLSVRAVEGIHRGPIMLYQIKMGEITLFHGGDSGYVPLKDYPSDIAFVPTGRMSPTASPENAYKMVTDIKPEIVVAMHGSGKQKQQFEQKVKESLPNTAVLILESYTTKTISLMKK
jgi:L-ascorbate metabolism protein UlaG (beta-lactamase superfamily)